MSSAYITENVQQKLKIIQNQLLDLGDDAFTQDVINLVLDHTQSQSKEALAQKLLKLIINNSQHQQLLSVYQQLNDELMQSAHDDQIAIMDTNSKIVCVNKPFNQIVGFKNPEYAYGLSYEDFHGEACEFADIFIQQDQKVLATQSSLTYVSYHQYAEGKWRLLYGEKNVILDKQQNIAGLFIRSKDITDHQLFDISRFLIHEQNNKFAKLQKKAFTYYINQQDLACILSKKEQEVLFYFIRGKTAQDIADILCRSKRTIEMHLESIKEKFQVPNKAALIEKAIVDGFMNVIPQSIFGKAL